MFAHGAWRGLHSVGVVDSIEALNGIGHAAVMCDPEFRAALAAHGYTLDDDGEIRQLAPYAGGFSQRAAQINRNIDRYEAAWRRAPRPGTRTGLAPYVGPPAWADARPDKVVPRDGADLAAAWNRELRDLGFTPPTIPVPRRVADRAADWSHQPRRRRRPRGQQAGREAVCVERRRHPRRGRAAIASVGVVAERPVRHELVEDIADRPAPGACPCWNAMTSPSMSAA